MFVGFFFVWAHHMFLSGLDIDSRAFFGMVTLLIGLPTCIKIFNWFLSFFGLDLFGVDVCLLYCFLCMFLFGGITGLLLANVGCDILLHDTYFVVAHFHYVLSLGAVLGFLSGFFHFITIWLPVEVFVFGLFVCFGLFVFGIFFSFFAIT